MTNAPGLDALQDVVRDYARGGPSRASDMPWRAPVRLLCDAARARDAQVEELVITLKRAWPAIAGAEQVPRDESSRLLSRVVTMCVEEYYAPFR